MKKVFALLLALVMVLSVSAVFAGCSKTETTPTTEGTEPTNPPTEPTTPPAKEAFKSFSMNLNASSMEAYLEDDGKVMLIYVTETENLFGKVDAAVLEDLMTALESSGYENLKEPEGEEDWGGDAKLEINFGDGKIFTYEYYHSQIPEDFQQVFEKMNTAFIEAVKLLPPPEVEIIGEIAENDKAAMDEILANLELWASANSFAMTAVPKEDEAFGFYTGLPSGDGVASGMNFGSKTNTVPYKLYLVTVSSGTDVKTVAETYKNSIDWRVFGCVFPDHAYIATKGDQVLMLLGKDDEFAQPYTLSVDAIQAAGWTLYAELTNPDIG